LAELRARAATVVYNIDHPGTTDAMDISDPPGGAPAQRANGFDRNFSGGAAGWGASPNGAGSSGMGWASPNATAAGGWAV
jgi:hypothetical protein